MSALRYWLWLSAAPVSPRAKRALLSTFGGAEEAFYAPKGAFADLAGLGVKEAAILEQRDLSRVEAIWNACQDQGVQIISLQDAAYPRRLKQIYAPPPVLYVKGRLPAVDENALFAVIGTRQASPYGLHMARDLAGQLCRCGGLLVSGLTHGIDAAAAEGALRAGGVCLGVLGTPHDQEYGELSRRVCERGALLSEYAPGTPVQRSFFRERNRIAAGLSVGVVVVEAPERSGARLFAAEAAEQGKEIFAVPGNADAVNSAGTLAMIKEGARLVTGGWDVAAEFEALFPGKLHPAAPLGMPPEPEAESAAAAVEEPVTAPESGKKAIDKPENRAYSDLSEQLSALTEDQLKIVTAIDREASHIDDIVEATGLPAARVLAQLTLLEIKGYVRRQAGMRIALNIGKK